MDKIGVFKDTPAPLPKKEWKKCQVCFIPL